MKGKDLTVQKPRKELKDVTEKEFQRLRSRGRIVRRPNKVVNETGETELLCSDNVKRIIVNSGGTIQNAFPRERMSKKARRVWRKEQEVLHG